MGTGPNTIQQGDCLEKLARIEPGSVDLAFADPPFNIGYEYDVYDDRRSRREYLDWSRRWIAAVAAALKPTGTFWLAIGDEYAAELKLIAQDDVGLTCRSWVIWYYTFGVNCVRGFSRSHTHLFHFVKDPNHFTFNAENPAVRVPSARQLVYADNRANPRGRLPDNTWIFRPQDAAPGSFAPQHDTWYFARVAGTFKEREGFHGCQMPEQLLGRIIRTSSKPRDLVLDPFAGSGTTLAVAKKLGRQWLGIELSPEYAQRVAQRLEATAAGDPLDGPADPLRSAPTTKRGLRKGRLRNGRPLPQSDEKTEAAIIAAYRDASPATADQLLCDPELNAAFVQRCKQQGLEGEASIWNRLLLRIRKTGKLPATASPRRRGSLKAMDAYSFASEIAMQLLQLDYGLVLDDILCTPRAAAEFDRIAAGFAPGFTPREYRLAALAIRKRAKTSKRLAAERCVEWLDKKLPRRVPLARCVGDGDRYARPGVYLLGAARQTLYVGETIDVRRRIEQVSPCEGWSRLAPEWLRFIPSETGSLQHGLQSLLIYRTRPLLNSQLLRPQLAAQELPSTA